MPIRLQFCFVKAVFFIVGPTGTGKSKLAADVAQEIGAEIVSADAFQIYDGLDLLTAKPDATSFAKALHAVMGVVPSHEGMSSEEFRRVAARTIDEIHSRSKLAVVVGGSELYVKALTHGLSSVPESDPTLRAKLNATGIEDLRSQLIALDPRSARKIDMQNRRRLVRAVEICLLTGKAASTQRTQWRSAAGVTDTDRPGSPIPATGVFVFRDRDELYARINHRVKAMFENGVIEEVRAIGAISSTALIETRQQRTQERALLIGLEKEGVSKWDLQDSLAELRELANSAGAEVIDTVTQKLQKPTAPYYIGRGKAESIKDSCQDRHVTSVIFDDELSPAQGRNLENLFARKVLDRTQLILDIFAQRARSREGRLQIELAQLQYLLPRLTRMWHHLSRQTGGIGTRGPGETQLEVDRRRVQERIARLERELEAVRRTRAVQRRGRKR